MTLGGSPGADEMARIDEAAQRLGLAEDALMATLTAAERTPAY